MRRTLLLLAAVVLFAGLAAPAYAQFARAGLEGTVTDPDGSPLPGVTVTVVNEATGQSRSAVTSATGRYVFNGLTPATYTVRFELQGFNSAEREGVRLLVGKAPTLNMQLQLGGVEETVTVTADAPLIETTSKEIGGNVTSEEFVELPTQNRSFVMFAGLLPGVVTNPSTESTASDSLFVNGQDDNNNNFNVDGAENNDDVIGARAGAQARTAIEAIQEFQILTTQFDAEYGRTTGAVLNAITKSGGNSLHGSGFFYYQDSGLNAKNFFTARNNAPQPDFTFKSVGGTLGGPVVPNHLFFFGSYERLTPNEGISRAFDTRPDLNFTTVEDNLVQNWMVKLDWQATENHRLAARFLREYSPQFNQIIGGATTLEAAREEDDTDTSFVGSVDSVISDRAFNNLRVSLTRENVSFANPGFNNNGQDFAAQRNLDVAQSRPTVLEGANTVAQSRINQSLQFDDTFSVFVAESMGGDHNVRIGGHYSHRIEDFSNFGTANGIFSFDTDTPWDPNDLATYPTQFNLLINGETTADIPANNVVGLFLQDDFQPSENLTLNLGVRWDHETITDDSNNFGPRLGFAWDPAGDGRTVVRGGWGRFYERFQLGSFSGYYLDAITGTGGFVTRVPTSGQDQQLFYDMVQANGITTLNGLRDFLASQLEGGAAPINTFPTVNNPDRVQARADTFSVGVERQVADQLSVGVDLIHTHNSDIVVGADLNPFSSSQGGRPNLSVFNGEQVALGSITTHINAGESNYNAIQVSVKRRMADSSIGRFQTQVSYTYAGQSGTAAPENIEFSNRWQMRTESGYNFDTGQFLGAPVDLGLQNNDGMPAPWHRNHNLVASWAWYVPGTSLEGRNAGLLFSGVGRIQSGDHFTALLLDRLDNNNRRPAPAGTYSANTASDIALDAISTDGIDNTSEGPGYFRLDLSFRYKVPFNRFNITVLADIFNATNHVNYANIGTSFVELGGFLIPTSAFQPREFQLGIRADF